MQGFVRFLVLYSFLAMRTEKIVLFAWTPTLKPAANVAIHLKLKIGAVVGGNDHP